jgi:hypothetical protein
VDLSNGYLTLGTYHADGIATCYHDIEVCILSR